MHFYYKYSKTNNKRFLTMQLIKTHFGGENGMETQVQRKGIQSCAT